MRDLDVSPESGSRPEPRMAFLRAPRPLQAWVVTTVLAGLALPVALGPWGYQHTTSDSALTAFAVIGLSVLNVEIGRLLEGGRAATQRPHKGLSAWAFASALLMPTWVLLPVVAISYGHAWWRGLRVTPWKWVGSAAYVLLAALAAALAARAVTGPHPDLMLGDGGRGVVAVLVGALVFLVTETICFHGSAYLNDAADEAWLRQTLATPSFYLTEAGVLLVGGLSAALWTGGAWFVLLLLPVYALTQRAALHEPLRELAEHDGKTGALRFESWRRSAMAATERCRRRGQVCCVLFADIDHFKQFNDAWGHLVGDQALVAVVAAIRGQLRPDDLLGRFGGEEFCVFLPNLDAGTGHAVAERIRTAVAAAQVEGAGPVTISVGVAVVGPGPEPLEFAPVLMAADRALFSAKDDGRNRTVLQMVSPT